MSAVVEPIQLPVETDSPNTDLIDRIAHALPEEVRAEYYRELRHCRALPESDEMLRLLRAMQFLVLLIEQAPSRVAEERERLDKLLAGAIANMNKINTVSESYHTSLHRKLINLPAEIANGISPTAIAGKINENLQKEFVRTAIPQTAQALAITSDQLKKVSSEFAITADTLGHSHRGAAEDARKAIAALKTEVGQAADAAARFTNEVAEKFAAGYRWMLIGLTTGSLVLGLAVGMMLERWLFSPSPYTQPAATVSAPASQIPQKN